MQPTDVRPIREAVDAAQQFAHTKALNGCDAGDIDEVVALLRRELERPQPNVRTLASYMNSLLRSLRPLRHAAQIVSRLDEVMVHSGIPTDL